MPDALRQPNGSPGPRVPGASLRLLLLRADVFSFPVPLSARRGSARPLIATGGILVYSVDVRIAPGKAPIRVQGDYSGDWPDSSVLLQPGEKITVTGYEISVTSKVGNDYFIEISTP